MLHTVLGRQCTVGRRKRACLAIVAIAVAGWTVPLPAQDSGRAIEGRDAKKTFSMTLKAEPSSALCYPSTTVEYQQHGPNVAVSGAISVDDCDKASGRYQVSLGVRDDDGEMRNIDFDESWSRDNASPIALQKSYAIGDGVDLIRVRLRSKECLCAETADAPESEP